MRELEQRGVGFEDYDLPDLKTVDHVCVLGSDKAAWFKDPDGNVLCVHETVRVGQDPRRSRRIRWLASLPGEPITQPPGWVPEPHW